MYLQKNFIYRACVFAKFITSARKLCEQCEDMDKLIGLTMDPTYVTLREYYEKNIKELNVRQMFKNDEERFKKFSLKIETNESCILVDYSKNIIDDEIFKLLMKLAKSRRLEEAIEEMFKGERINVTENRPVLHIALRNRGKKPILVNGIDVMDDVKSVLGCMKVFVNDIYSGEHLGFTGMNISDVVNIGIGGSDLGPVMVTEALKPFAKGLQVHFVSNIDGTNLNEVLKKVRADTTLFIVSSKTFTTQETMVNAQSAKEWLLSHLKDPRAVSKHFVAISTNRAAAKEFGIEGKNVFAFWDWVGGRFSLWSAIGLSIALYIGFDNFEKLLDGAYCMDEKFKKYPFHQNAPVILGMLGVWYANFFCAETHAILPYDQYLHRLPAYIQQLEMESNGKRTTKSNSIANYSTGPVIWGEPGTNGQHSFYQFIHQGTKIVPCDFIVPAISHNPIAKNKHHKILLANYIAQTEALMLGKTPLEAETEMIRQGLSKQETAKLRLHKTFPGSRPSTSIAVKKITPFILGALIAMYEHKTFVQGIIWEINSFDQFGVELGKELAKEILIELQDDKPVNRHDVSTNGLINFIKSNWFNTFKES